MQHEINLYSNMEEFSTFTEPVTNQPTSAGFPGPRRPIPVSLIDQNLNRTFAPLSGLDFLHDVNQLIIQQSIELADLSSVSSENRYTIRNPRGDTIYYATESSDGCQRMCFGSGRDFSMRLYDKTQQETLLLKRRLACGTCTFWCYLQKMEIWIPPGELLGTISQNMSFNMKPNFHVYNRHNELLYRIEGPSSFGCLLGKAENFQIYNFDGSTQIGSIIYQWDQVQVSYNILLQMPSNIRETRYKALLMGSAFLLEYMFFESSKKSRCHCSC
nr:phospholipid scramblase 2-like isoform X2 [Leptinotarsa decemlineata]